MKNGANKERNPVEEQHQLAEIELHRYLVTNSFQSKDVEAFKEALNNSKCEEDVQIFLTQNNHLLRPGRFGANNGYVIPKPKLAHVLVPDFLIAWFSSYGVHWTAVELESPLADMSTAEGQPSAKLTHAIQQIIDWREWLTSNIGFARRSTNESGLGLIGIDGNLPATIFMGRRKNYPASFNAFRRQKEIREGISIHSYDSFLP